MQSCGHRAWMEGGKGALSWPCPTAPSCPELPLQLPGRKTRPFLMRRDKNQGTGGAEALERIFLPNLGWGGARLKPGELPHASCHPWAHIPHGTRVPALCHSPALTLELITQAGRRAVYSDTRGSPGKVLGCHRELCCAQEIGLLPSPWLALQHGWVTPGGQLAMTWSPGATCPHS